MTSSRWPHTRPTSAQPSVEALEVTAMLQRENVAGDTAVAPRHLPERFEERALIDDTPGFTSGTLTEAVPVSHGGRTYRVKSSDTIVSIAKKHGVSVPALVELNDLQGRAVVRPGQVLSLPEKNVAPPPASHRVRPGESLEAIALKYATSVSQLMRANAMSSKHIVVGETLMLTGSGATSARVKPQPAGRLPSLPRQGSGGPYPAEVVAAARFNKWVLGARPAPRRSWVHQTLVRLAGEIGVSPHLALAVAMTESGLHHKTVSPVNGIGIMQVTPSACQWAASLAGRDLNVADPADNMVAGLTILKSLIATTESVPAAIAAYYQGAASIERNGLAPDTRAFVRAVQVLANRYATTGSHAPAATSAPEFLHTGGAHEGG